MSLAKSHEPFHLGIHGYIYLWDWTIGMEYWTGLLGFIKKSFRDKNLGSVQCMLISNYLPYMPLETLVAHELKVT